MNGGSLFLRNTRLNSSKTRIFYKFNLFKNIEINHSKFYCAKIKKSLVKRSEFTKKAIVILKRRLMKIRKYLASKISPFRLFIISLAHMNKKHDHKHRLSDCNLQFKIRLMLESRSDLILKHSAVDLIFYGVMKNK